MQLVGWGERAALLRIQTAQDGADLEVTKTVDDATPALGDTVTFTITVENKGPATATNVTIKDTLSSGLTFISAGSPSTGSYNSGTNVWTIPALASGNTATLTIDARVDMRGVSNNNAEVTAGDQEDPDSTPDNNDPLEDDQDAACVTVEVYICDGEQYILYAPKGLNNYTWTRNGQTIGGANADTLIVTQPGSYNYMATDDNNCPAMGDCDVVFVDGDPIIDMITPMDVSACGLTDGSITITASGGSGSFEYSINGGANFQDGNVFNNLDTGSYDIVVRDKISGCETSGGTTQVGKPNCLPIANLDRDTTNEDTPVTIDVTANDDFGGDGPSTVDIVITDQPNNGTAVVNDQGDNDPTNDEITYTPNANFNGQDTLIYEIEDANGDTDTALVVITVAPTKARLNLRVLLQGALLGEAGTIMQDSLRARGFLPLTEPYAALSATYPQFTHVNNNGGGEMIGDSATVLADRGVASIVDWVFVELRDANDSTVVVATRSGLVQRNGIVVDTNGVEPLTFCVAPADYYVVVRHRNHLGVMTKTALSISATGTVVDFTDTNTDFYEQNGIFDGVE